MERGLVYRQGRSVRVLEPGAYWVFGPVSVYHVDMRRRRVFVDVAPVQLKDRGGCNGARRQPRPCTFGDWPKSASQKSARKNSVPSR